MLQLEIKGARSHQPCWVARLRDNYSSYEEFESCSRVYGLAKRLGFTTHEDAWDENPWVHGSVYPEDYGLHVFPKQYLHVRECKTDKQWIRPLRKNSLLDLTTQVRKWVKEEFAGELFLDGKIQPKLEGDYYAALFTDSRPLDGVCWESGGFWLTNISNGLLRLWCESGYKKG